MSSKSAKKKKFIIETSRALFAEKGYKDVTMKDIVDACGISRGGLYLYFESTAQIFTEVMKMETQDTDDEMSQAIRDDSSASDILELFLSAQKKEIMRMDNDLSVAKYEFYMSHRLPHRDNIMRCTIDEAVDVIADLIDTGIAGGEMICGDPKAAARNIMFVIEGLKISSRTIDISEKIIDEQLSYLLGGLLIS